MVILFMVDFGLGCSWGPLIWLCVLGDLVEGQWWWSEVIELAPERQVTCPGGAAVPVTTSLLPNFM